MAKKQGDQIVVNLARALTQEEQDRRESYLASLGWMQRHVAEDRCAEAGCNCKHPETGVWNHGYLAETWADEVLGEALPFDHPAWDAAFQAVTEAKGLPAKKRKQARR